MLHFIVLIAKRELKTIKLWEKEDFLNYKVMLRVVGLIMIASKSSNSPVVKHLL